MAGKRIWIGLGLIVLVILAYAWIDGGREPLRPIAQEVPVPEQLP